MTQNEMISARPVRGSNSPRRKRAPLLAEVALSAAAGPPGSATSASPIGLLYRAVTGHCSLP